MGVGDVLPGEPAEVVETKRSTASALRKDAALLKSMLAQDEDRRRQTRLGSKKLSRNKSLRLSQQSLESIEEETAADVSSVDNKDIEQPSKIGPYEDDDGEEMVKKRKSKKKVRTEDELKKKRKKKRPQMEGNQEDVTASHQHRRKHRKKREETEGEQDDGIVSHRHRTKHRKKREETAEHWEDEAKLSQQHRTKHRKKKEETEGDQEDDLKPPQKRRTKHRTKREAKKTENEDFQKTKESAQRATSSGFYASEQAPPGEETSPESRRSSSASRRSLFGDSDISDITSDSKAFERIKKAMAQQAMAQKRPSNIESEKSASISDITDDSKAFAIAKQTIIESDKEAQLSETPATWTEFDTNKWQSSVQADGRPQTRRDNFGNEEFLKQPKSRSISDLDKGEPFHDNFEPRGEIPPPDDDQDLIKEWDMWFESGYSKETQDLVAEMIGAKNGQSARVPPAASMQQGAAHLRASAPALIEDTKNSVAMMPPGVNATSRSTSAPALMPPRRSNRRLKNARSHELLARYIQSMGTDPRVARNVARSFARSQPELERDCEWHSVNYYSSTEEDQTDVDLDASERALLCGSERPQSEHMPSSSVLGATVNISPGGNHRYRARWPWFETPGAVQMHTRAFGAPVRVAPSPSGDIEDGSASESVAPREVVVEARAVSDDESESRVARSPMPPVVYAEQLSFALWARQHPFFRGAVVLLVFAIAAVIASVLAVWLTKDDTPANNTGDSPSAAPTFVSREFVLELESVSGSDALSEPGSPQRRAIGWLSSIDQSGMEADDSELIQRYVLVVLYFATEGEKWVERENWLSPSLHECQWGSAISCKTDPSNRQIVTGLDLSRHGMKGELPPEIGYLTQVEHFSVSRNSLNGTLPASLFNMTRLAVLDAHENDFTGSIPSSINGAPFIVDLDLSKNLFSGTIPEALYDLSILRTLDVSVNQLSGILASGLGKLRVLTKFNIRSNLITGIIPDTFDALTNLAVVNLDNNLITGNIPEWTAVLVQRQELTVSYNLLTGVIPGAPEGGLAALGGVTPESYRLSKVDLSNNRLRGTIPVEVAFIPSLRYIDFSNNRQLQGPFPSFPGIGLWQSIEYLAASNCQLTGTVPMAFAPTLTHYEFHGNNLVGGFPPELCDFPELEYLSLAFNDIGGKIPAPVGSMNRLEALDLRACGLTGTIPDFKSMKSLASVDLAENSLGGSLLTEIGLLRTLTEFVVYSNQITGSLPSEIGLLTNLVVLDLRENFMTGEIPKDLGRMTDLDQFLVANNYFQGGVPESVCSLVDDLRFVDVGCELECSCCSDGASTCVTGSRAPPKNGMKLRRG